MQGVYDTDSSTRHSGLLKYSVTAEKTSCNPNMLASCQKCSDLQWHWNYSFPPVLQVGLNDEAIPLQVDRGLNVSLAEPHNSLWPVATWRPMIHDNTFCFVCHKFTVPGNTEIAVHELCYLFTQGGQASSHLRSLVHIFTNAPRGAIHQT